MSYPHRWTGNHKESFSDNTKIAAIIFVVGLIVVPLLLAKIIMLF